MYQDNHDSGAFFVLHWLRHMFQHISSSFQTLHAVTTTTRLKTIIKSRRRTKMLLS